MTTYDSVLSSRLGSLEQLVHSRPTPAHTTDTTLYEFDPKSRIQYFEGKFPAEMTLMRELGIHPLDKRPIFDPYTQKTSTEDWTNVGEHCIAVAHAARCIASALQEQSLLSFGEVDFITRRALVHDIQKPYEQFRKKAKAAGVNVDVYTEAAYEGLTKLLTAAGCDSNVAQYIASAGKETGHNSIKDFIEVRNGVLTGGITGSIVNKVIHLADDMTSTSKGDEGKVITLFMTPWERMLQSNFIEKYSFMRKEGLVLTENGTLVPSRNLATTPTTDTVVGSYFDLQVKVSDQICREIQLLLSPESTEHPAVFVKRLIGTCRVDA